MKKYILLFIYILFLLPINVFAGTCEPDKITIESINLDSVTGSASEKEEATANGKSINLNLQMNEVGDSANYTIKVKNDSDNDYELNESSFNLSTDYIEYTITTEDNSNVIPGKDTKDVYLKVHYKEEVPIEELSTGTYSDTSRMDIGITSNINDNVPVITPTPTPTPTPGIIPTPVPANDVKVPDTFANSNAILIVGLIIIGGVAIYYYKKNKYVTISLITIGVVLLISSKSSFALCTANIQINSNVEIELKETTFKTGKEVNARMKQFVKSDATYSKFDTTITKIARFVGNPDISNLIDENIVSTPESDVPIYMWYDEPTTTIYWYSKANYVYYNEDSSHFYYYLSGLKDLLNINDIRTNRTTNMSYMFSLIGGTNTIVVLDLGDNFDTSNVTDMSYMFYGCEHVSTIYATDKFVTTNVTDSTRMFYTDYELTGQLGTAFDSANNNIDVTFAHIDEGFDNPGYFSLKEEFDGAMFMAGAYVNEHMKKLVNPDARYNSDDTSIKSIARFDGTPDESVLIEDNIVSTVISKYPIYMWYDSNDSIIYWYSETNNVYYSPNCRYFYQQLKGLNSIENINDINTSYVGTMMSMFSYTGYDSTSFVLDLGTNFDTSNVQFMNTMFYQTGSNSNQFTLDLGPKFNTSKVKNMSSMFAEAGSNNTGFTLNLGDNFDTSSVTNMYAMFQETGHKSTIFTLDLGDKFDTSNVTNMSWMFSFTGSYSNYFTLDLEDNFDTSNVTNMSYMFNGTGLNGTIFTLRLGNHFNTSKVTNMEQMFNSIGQNNPSFTFELGALFDTSNVTNMQRMFERMGYNSTAFTTLNLGSKFNTSNVTNMAQMFGAHRYLTTIYAPESFVTTAVTNSRNMFFGNANLVGEQGTVYNASNTDATYAHIDGGTSNPGYFSTIVQ